MNDFLHNLRSGKLNQQHRRKRSYDEQQYKGNKRRGPMDRRKMESDNIELINTLKDALQAVNETHNRIAAAHETLAKSEERKATAIEKIADNFHRIFYQPQIESDAQLMSETLPAMIAPTAAKESPEAPGPSQSKAQDAEVKKLTASTKMAIFNLTREMREDGDSWAKIARAIAAKGYPTVSGKGRWRGDMVKKLYEKMA